VKPVPVRPSPDRPRIGARLRAARQRQGLTIDQVAAAAEVTKGFVSRVERDETSPSVATLVTLCEVAENDLVRRAEAPEIHLTGDGAAETLVTPRGQSRLQMIRSSISPGGSGGDELYTLNCELEVLHVLKGRLDLVFSKETHRLMAGDTVTFAGREPHTWRNPDAARAAEAIWVIVPASWDTSV
jgi:transcriptional regulator with XRE-family HTH domain